MRKGSKETLRSLLRKLIIVILLVTAVLLWRETGYLSGVLWQLKTGEHTALSGNAQETGLKPAGSIQPLAAMVCSAEGGHCGAAWERESVMAVFYRFSADIGEALGSAGEPLPVSEEAFRAALSCSGVMLRFYSPQPLELLQVWLGAEMSGAAAQCRAELLCLCAEADSVRLYFRAETGEFFSCTTAVNRDGLLARTAEYAPNGAYYAYENATLAGCDDYSIILDGAVTSALVQRSIPTRSEEETDALLRAVGMNSYTASSYTEADGTVVFVNDENTLRISPAGELFFHRSALNDHKADQSMYNAVNTAWTLAEQSIGSSCGDAVLLLAEVSGGEAAKSCTVALDYAVNGIPVRLSSGHAAEIVLRDGIVVQAQLTFRRYAVTEQRETLLPCLQAAAIAAEAQATAELIYADGGEIMSCIWVRSDG